MGLWGEVGEGWGWQVSGGGGGREGNGGSQRLSHPLRFSSILEKCAKLLAMIRLAIN